MSKVSLKDKLGILAFGLVKVPMLFYISPKLIKNDDDGVVFKIPFKKRNKNHVNSMYFGVLCCGADLAAGYLTMSVIKQSKRKVSLIFKDFDAKFLKLVKGDAHFSCTASTELRQLVEEAISTKERVNKQVPVTVTVPSIDENEILAEFNITVSIKLRE